MAFLYSLRKCSLSLLVGHWMALTRLELVDGVAEFLHRERFHCMLVLLVLVLVFVCLRL